MTCNVQPVCVANVQPTSAAEVQPTCAARFRCGCATGSEAGFVVDERARSDVRQCSTQHGIYKGECPICGIPLSYLLLRLGYGMDGRPAPALPVTVCPAGLYSPVAASARCLSTRSVFGCITKLPSSFAMRVLKVVSIPGLQSLRTRTMNRVVL